MSQTFDTKLKVSKIFLRYCIFLLYFPTLYICNFYKIFQNIFSLFSLTKNQIKLFSKNIFAIFQNERSLAYSFHKLKFVTQNPVEAGLKISIKTIDFYVRTIKKISKSNIREKSVDKKIPELAEQLGQVLKKTPEEKVRIAINRQLIIAFLFSNFFFFLPLWESSLEQNSTLNVCRGKKLCCFFFLLADIFE